MSAGKTCHVCTQLERFFLTCTRLDAIDGRYEKFDKGKGGKKGTSSFYPGARFSKVPIINGPGKLSPFTFKIEVSIVLHLT